MSEQNERRNLKISGAGSASGGIYEDVRVSGAGEINGDIECVTFKTSGASETKGNVKAQVVETSGASEIKGNLTAEKIITSGASEIKGDVKTKSIKISGASEIGGCLEAEEVEVRGAVEIGGNCEAETFYASGAFDIDGLLNAGKIEIKVYGKCKVKEIGGENISISKGDGAFAGIQKFINSLINRKEFLDVDLIEGDEIYLESTIAKTVRGNRIIVSEDCVIDNIEYRDDLKIEGNGKVNDSRKM